MIESAIVEWALVSASANKEKTIHETTLWLWLMIIDKLNKRFKPEPMIYIGENCKIGTKVIDDSFNNEIVESTSATMSLLIKY